LCSAILISGSAIAQAGGQTEPYRAKQLAELYGKLSSTRVNVWLDDIRTEDALDLLQSAIGVTIRGLFTTMRDGEIVTGVNPDTPISIRFHDVSALDALEMILDQAVEFEPVTWQLRNGYVEVGTKNRLMNHSERRVYAVGDLLMEAPDLTPPSSRATGLFGFGGGAAMRAGSPPSSGPRRPPRGQSSAASRPGRTIDRYWGESDEQVLVDELVRVLSETIEPERWQHHDHMPYSTDEHATGGIDPRSSERRKARLDVGGMETLVVVAPDFMHRQINGYPGAIRPAPLTPEEIEARNARARLGDSFIAVIGSSEDSER